jgi:hypothetical protein
MHSYTFMFNYVTSKAFLGLQAEEIHLCGKRIIGPAAAVLCYAMLCCAMMCAMLSCVVMCCAMLCCDVLVTCAVLACDGYLVL